MIFFEQLSIYGNFGLGILFSLFMIYASIVSFIEKENRAAIVSTILMIGIALVLVLPFFVDFFIQYYYHEIVFSTIVFSGLLLLFNKRSNKFTPETANSKYDERNIMFSRKELENDLEKFEAYYAKHPEKKELDDLFREKPGLLEDNAAFYNPYTFNASRTTFDIIEAFYPKINGAVSPVKKDQGAEFNTQFIKNWAKKLGAKGVGITPMKDYHFYSVKGRRERYGEKIANNHKYGIALTVEMDKFSIDSAPQSQVIMESTQQYFNSGAIAVLIAEFIRQMGYPATAHIDGNYEVVCPLVAKDAGLGEIGRMGLLMTPKQGPRVRIAVITTDMPLDADQAFDDSSVIEFCTYCKKCAVVCPSQSIPKDDRKEMNGVKRWQINSEGCFTYWCIAGTDCTRCMKVCPYSHPGNFFHNMIRFGIKHSYLFRRFAVYMDDVFYGKKPKSSPMPRWIPKNK